MKEFDSKNDDQLCIIEEKIKEAQKHIEDLAQKKIIIKNPLDMEAIEKDIIKATDKLAGLIIAKKIQQSIDSTEMRTESKQFVESLPKKLKNQGKREVEIYPSRGGPVKVKASYFSNKDKKK